MAAVLRKGPGGRIAQLQTVKPTMQLFVRTDRTLSLQAEISTTVSSLKTQLQQRTGEQRMGINTRCVFIRLHCQPARQPACLLLSRYFCICVQVWWRQSSGSSTAASSCRMVRRCGPAGCSQTPRCTSCCGCAAARAASALCCARAPGRRSVKTRTRVATSVGAACAM